MIKSKDRIVQLTTKGSKKITRDKNDLTLIPWPLLGASLSTNSQIQIGRQWFLSLHHKHICSQFWRGYLYWSRYYWRNYPFLCSNIIAIVASNSGQFLYPLRVRFSVRYNVVCQSWLEGNGVCICLCNIFLTFDTIF